MLAISVFPFRACKKSTKIQFHYSLVIQCPNKIWIPLLEYQSSTISDTTHSFSIINNEQENNDHYNNLPLLSRRQGHTGFSQTSRKDSCFYNLDLLIWPKSGTITTIFRVLVCPEFILPEMWLNVPQIRGKTGSNTSHNKAQQGREKV